MAKEEKKMRRRRLALLLPGHNEELIIAATIKSAVAAGQSLQDIFVVDDASSDDTRQQAISLLPAENVLSVEHSGKAMAVNKGIRYFKIEDRYTWLHVADADSVFGPEYFKIFRANLNTKEFVVAIGFVQSLRGNWISHYRAFWYTYGQNIMRRFQSWLGIISVFPGPVTCFNTRIIKDLDFTADSLTEDFDITLQVHRKKLGKVKFIPKAVSYTQDPQSLKDFCKQVARWQRGYFQGVVQHKIGTKFQVIDTAIVYQLIEAFMYIVNFGILIPLAAIESHQYFIVPLLFFVDFVVMSIIAVISAGFIRRMGIVKSLPAFYVLRWIELGIFIMAFVEVVLMRRYRKRSSVGWAVKGRRYKLSSEALQDVAK